MKSRWEKSDPERADPGRPTSHRTGRHPEALRSCGFRSGSGKGAVRVCRVPGNRDPPTVAAATGKAFSVYRRPAASLVCCPCPAHAQKRNAGGSHELGGQLAEARRAGSCWEARVGRRKQVLARSSPSTRLPALEHGVCTPNSWQGKFEAGEPEGGDEEPVDRIPKSTPPGASAGERLHALPFPLSVLC